MPYQIQPSGNRFKIKNLKTGKTGKLRFSTKEKAQAQINNRMKYEKMISRNRGNNN
jgi:translation elongation factor P/translation initiation factor 5A